MIELFLPKIQYDVGLLPWGNLGWPMRADNSQLTLEYVLWIDADGIVLLRMSKIITYYLALLFVRLYF